jgi:hypothetical protein
MAQRYKGLLRRFEDGIKSKASCWDVAPTAKGGYGKIKFLGKTYLYHRMSYMLYCGTIPDEMMVCHKCDNPKCVNPDHLFLGTAQDNMSDKIQKGRHKGAKSGFMHHNAKLNDFEVESIRQMLASGHTQRSIANIYSVSQSIISRIKTGKGWKQ